MFSPDGILISASAAPHCGKDVLYFLSDPDNEPRIRFVIPRHFAPELVKQYHDDNGHMGIDKAHDTLKQKYYWPDLYRKLSECINRCAVSLYQK